MRIFVFFLYFYYGHYGYYTHYKRLPYRYVDTSCTHWLAVGDSTEDLSTEDLILRAVLDYRRIRHGDAGKLGNYPILAFLPDKMARFLYEFHAFRFESLGLPPLPADRSNFDVHGAIGDEQVPYL